MGSFDSTAPFNSTAPYIGVYGDPTTPNGNTAGRHEVVVVDATVADWQTLVAGISPDTPLLVLHPDANGMGEVEVLAAFLAQHQNLDAIHLVTEGRTGALLLGNEALYEGDLQAASPYLAQIGSALKPGGDVMLYGCSVAAGAAGQQFVDDLSQALGGVDVAASTNRTGPTALGGDWNLEYATGNIETVLPFTLAGMQDISHCLGCTGTNGLPYTTTGTIIGTDGTTQWAHWVSTNVWLADVALTVNGSPYSIGQEIGIDSNADFMIGFIAECTPSANAAPTFVGATTTLSVSENATATNIAGLLHVSDSDASQTETWTVSTATNHSGTVTLTGATASSGSADITPGGTLTYTPAANYVGTETFTIQVADNAGTPGTATRQITVTVTDVNPSISDATVSLAENSANATAVTTVTATNDTNGLSYAITTGNTGNAFTINAATGAITVVDSTQLNFEGTASYSLTVAVDDEDLDATADSTATITVNLTNVNDAPTLSTISTLTGAGEDTAHTITYDDLLAAADEADVDAGATLSFRVEAVSSGTLTKGGSAVTAGATLLDAGESLVWTPAANASGSAINAFTVKAWDGALASSTAIQVKVDVAAVNDAPVLDTAQSPTLAGMGIDPAAPSNGSTSGSTLVSALVAGISDIDSGAVKGIAVTATDTVNGTLYYSTDAGATWTAAGAVSDTSALLLAADANTRLYYQSNTGVSGNLASALTVRAWDQTSGTVGSKVDAATNGGTTAFSTATDTVAISIYPPPAIGGVTAGQAANDNATVTPFAATTIADTLGNNVTVAVTLDTQAKGSFTTLSGFTDNGNGSCTLTNVTAAAAQSAIRGLVFTPSADRVAVGSTETTTFTVAATDVVTSVTASNTTTTVVSTSINDAPTASNQTVATAEDTAYTFAAADFNFSDVDSGDSLSAVRIDSLPASGSLTLNGVAVTATDVILLADIGAGNLRFTPAPHANGVGNAGFTFSVQDSHSTFAAATRTLTLDVSAVNDAPTVSAPANVAVTEDVASAITGISVADVDAAGGSITATLSVGTGTLNATSGSGVTVGAGGTAAMTLTGTLADINTFIAGSNVSFTTALNATGSVTLTTAIDDGGNTGSGGARTGSSTTTLNVTAVNDAPTVTNVSGDTVNFSIGGGAVALDAGGNATVADIDSANFNGGNLTVAVTANGQAAEDVLSVGDVGSITVSGSTISHGGTVIGSFTGGSGGTNLVITLNADATPARVQDMVRALHYTDSDAATTNTAARTVRITLNDGSDTSAHQDVTINLVRAPIIDLNGAPVGNNHSASFTEDAGAVSISAGAADISDDGTIDSLTVTLSNRPDGAAESLSSTLGTGAQTVGGQSVTIGAYNSGTGVLTITGAGITTANMATVLQSIRYDNSSQAPDTTARSITVSATDNVGNVGNLSTTTLSITPTNDAPTLTANTGFTVAEGASHTLAAAELSVADVDNTTTQRSFTLGTASANGTLFKSGSALAAGGSFTQADIDAGSISYTHNGNETLSDSLIVTVSDGAGGSIAATTLNITVTPVNDAPTVATNTGLSLLTGTSSAISTTRLALADADTAAASLTLTVTTAPTQGTLWLDANDNHTHDAGEDLTAATTLTQADIAAGRLHYTHAGASLANDSFAFTTSDGAGGSIAATSFGITVTEPPAPEPEPAPTPTPTPVDDGDNVPAATEGLVPSLPSGNGTPTVTGDGNGDGLADSAQANVTSVPFRHTDQISTTPTAPATYVTLVADGPIGSNGGSNGGSTSAATLTNVAQTDAPADLPAGITMPLGLISFTATVSTPTGADGTGSTETFSLFVSADLGVNGYWKQDSSGTWVNLASQVTTVGDTIRLDFQIQDGGEFDADHTVNGSIVDPGAVAYMPLSITGHTPGLPHDGFWF